VQGTTAVALLVCALQSSAGDGFWCVNHAQGCAHGCRYPCYAYLMAKHYGRVRDEADWRRPRLVEHAVELLERQLARTRYVT